MYCRSCTDLVKIGSRCQCLVGNMSSRFRIGCRIIKGVPGSVCIPSYTSLGNCKTDSLATRRRGTLWRPPGGARFFAVASVAVPDIAAFSCPSSNSGSYVLEYSKSPSSSIASGDRCCFKHFDWNSSDSPSSFDTHDSQGQARAQIGQ